MPRTTARRDDDIGEIADQINRYLESHPDAADSSDGILRWWIARQRLEDSIGKVEQALALLLRKGLVRKRIMIDGQVLYVGAERARRDTH